MTDDLEFKIEPMTPIITRPGDVMASVKVTCPTGCFIYDYLWISMTELNTTDQDVIKREILEYLGDPLPKCRWCDASVELFNGTDSLRTHPVD